MQVITEPNSQVRQMSGLDLERSSILSVLAKRTYQILNDGRCALVEEQLPLIGEPENYPDNQKLLAQDTDLFPFKLFTDVIVKGHAYAGVNQSCFEAKIQISRYSKSILVIGERTCMVSPTGRLSFSAPKLLDRVPLRYDYAYGGRDSFAEQQYQNPLREFEAAFPETFDLEDCSPYIYPRNPYGVGYLMEATPNAVAQLRLPNLEDPEDSLSPERLIVGKPGRWPLLPLPQAMDWMNYDSFPRAAFFGILPEFEALNQPIAEVAKKHMGPEVMKPATVFERFNLRCTNGASIGLQIPYLKGDEEAELVGVHPKHPAFRFRLPGERPRIWTDGRKGKLNETQPVIHTIMIEPDESRLTILWRGSAPCLRAYMEEELEQMPLRVEWD